MIILYSYFILLKNKKYKFLLTNNVKLHSININ